MYLKQYVKNLASLKRQTKNLASLKRQTKNLASLKRQTKNLASLKRQTKNLASFKKIDFKIPPLIPIIGDVTSQKIKTTEKFPNSIDEIEDKILPKDEIEIGERKGPRNPHF